MPRVIIKNVPVHGDPAIAKQELMQNLKCSDDIDSIEIIFLQNNQSVQDAEVHLEKNEDKQYLIVQDAEVQLEKNEDKQYLIENSPLEYCFNGDPIPVELNIVESCKK